MCERKRKKERDRKKHMLTYQTNDGKRYNTKLFCKIRYVKYHLNKSTAAEASRLCAR